MSVITLKYTSHVRSGVSDNRSICVWFGWRILYICTYQY